MTKLDEQDYFSKWYSMHTEIRKDLEVMVDSRKPDEIRILQDDGNEFAHIVVLTREETRRAIEILQGWLGGTK